MSETKNEEERFWEFYKETAPVVFRQLHPYLFERIFRFLNTLGDERNLLVIGPGPYVLPFSEHPEEVSEMLGEKGRLVLMDYSAEVLVAAINFLEDSSFFKKSKLVNNSVKAVKNPDDLETRTVTFTKGDLREPLPFTDNSFNCVDMTLVAHHVTATLDDLDKVTSEVYRIMRPKGMLHYGEGFININTEQKIVGLAYKIRSFFGCPVLFKDERDKKYIKDYVFEYNKKETEEEKKKRESEEKRKGKKELRLPKDPKKLSLPAIDLILDNEGKLTIVTLREEDAERLCNYLKRDNSQATIYRDKNMLFMPLIDEKSPKAQKELITAIDSLYCSIENQVRKHFRNNKKVMEGIDDILEKEKEKAKKGLDEFFKSYVHVKKSLLKAGFTKIEKRVEHKESPFFSLIAFK